MILHEVIHLSGFFYYEGYVKTLSAREKDLSSILFFRAGV